MFFEERKTHPKIHKESQGNPQIAKKKKKILNNKTVRLTFLDFTTYYKVMVIKTVVLV